MSHIMSFMTSILELFSQCHSHKEYKAKMLHAFILKTLHNWISRLYNPHRQDVRDVTCLYIKNTAELN